MPKIGNLEHEVCKIGHLQLAQNLEDWTSLGDPR